MLWDLLVLVKTRKVGEMGGGGGGGKRAGEGKGLMKSSRKVKV